MSNENLLVSRELLDNLLGLAQIEADDRRAGLGNFRPHVQAYLDKVVADTQAILAQPASEPKPVDDEAAFEQWHNSFYGPQDPYNPIRSLEKHSELGFCDGVVTAQFAAFKGGRAHPAPAEPQPAAMASFEEWAEDALGLSPRKLASGDYQSFGMACAVKAWEARAAQPVAVEGMPERRRPPFGFSDEGWNSCLDTVAPLVASLKTEIEKLKRIIDDKN